MKPLDMESVLNVMKDNNCKPKFIFSNIRQASKAYHEGNFKSKGGQIYFDDIKVINYMTGHQITYSELLSPKDV